MVRELPFLRPVADFRPLVLRFVRRLPDGGGEQLLSRSAPAGAYSASLSSSCMLAMDGQAQSAR